MAQQCEHAVLHRRLEVERRGDRQLVKVHGDDVAADAGVVLVVSTPPIAVHEGGRPRDEAVDDRDREQVPAVRGTDVVQVRNVHAERRHGEQHLRLRPVGDHAAVGDGGPDGEERQDVEEQVDLAADLAADDAASVLILHRGIFEAHLPEAHAVQQLFVAGLGDREHFVVPEQPLPLRAGLQRRELSFGVIVAAGVARRAQVGAVVVGPRVQVLALHQGLSRSLRRCTGVGWRVRGGVEGGGLAHVRHRDRFGQRLAQHGVARLEPAAGLLALHFTEAGHVGAQKQRLVLNVEDRDGRLLGRGRRGCRCRGREVREGRRVRDRAHGDADGGVLGLSSIAVAPGVRAAPL
mmetsp:Transcript_22891/g.70982  ORF Transcript_22891/g.70982 Transcript_22891/m.70982 type:complete len:349 (-) Transcript_22891:361-1407(-)